MSIEDTINEVLGVLQFYEFSLTDEKVLQELIYETLLAEDVAIDREVPLPPYGIVDFMVNGVAFEVKIQGQKKAIYRQCRDYTLHEDVKALVLVTARSMGLPPEMNGKPAYVYSLTSRTTC